MSGLSEAGGNMMYAVARSGRACVHRLGKEGWGVRFCSTDFGVFFLGL